MYVPDRFRESDPAVLRAFMESHPFAILVTVDDSSPRGTHVPVATHVPVVVRDAPGGRLVLEGHIARQNPQAHAFERGTESLVIFHGPHAYIRPDGTTSRAYPRGTT